MKLVYFERFHGHVQDAKNRVKMCFILAWDMIFENCDLPVILFFFENRNRNSIYSRESVEHS